jgi:hypothetical protein
MTDLLIDRDPNDSGEIARPSVVAALTEPTAAMKRIAPPYTETSEPVLRLYVTDEMPIYVPRSIDGPQAPPPPLPPIPPGPVIPPRISTPEPSHAGHLPPTGPDESGVIPMFVDVADRQAHAELGEYLLRRSVPYVLPADRPGWTVARHRRPSVWSQAWARIWGAIR